MMNRRTCLIYNPTAARGRPPLERQRRWQRIDPAITVFPTQSSGHAKTLAMTAVQEGYTHLIAAGGDGNAHEVANGILEANNPECVLTVLPWGSANDYAETLGLTRWWNERRDWGELQLMTVDVGCVRAAHRTCYFVNGCGVGFNGRVTIESRAIRSLSGIPLYAVAMIRAMLKHFRTPDFTIKFDHESVTQPTLALTLGLAQREGGFPLTADAILDDGLLDWLLIGDVQRWELIRYLPNMIRGDLPTDHPHVRRGRSRCVRVESTEPLCVHADGEFVCEPSIPEHQIEVEILPRRLLVHAFPPGLYGRKALSENRHNR